MMLIGGNDNKQTVRLGVQGPKLHRVRTWNYYFPTFRMETFSKVSERSESRKWRDLGEIRIVLNNSNISQQ